MKSLLKNLGVILVIIGAVILIACFANGNAYRYQQTHHRLTPCLII